MARLPTGCFGPALPFVPDHLGSSSAPLSVRATFLPSALRLPVAPAGTVSCDGILARSQSCGYADERHSDERARACKSNRNGVAAPCLGAASTCTGRNSLALILGALSENLASSRTAMRAPREMERSER